MTNVQLLLSIAIPSLLIVLSWLNNNSRFERIEKRLDGHDTRFDKQDARMDRLDDKFTVKLDEVKAANHKDALEIMRSMTALHERVAVVESKQAS